MDLLASELRRQFNRRVAAAEQLVEDLQGTMPSRPGRAHRALSLYSEYCKHLLVTVATDWDNAADGQDRVDLLRFYSRNLVDRVGELEDWFASSALDEVPVWVVEYAERELRELLTEERQAILAIGPPDNYETYVAELQTEVFHVLQEKPDLPEELLAPFALLSLPRTDMQDPSWLPILLGHEIAHLALQDRNTIDDFDVDAHLDEGVTKTLNIPSHLTSLRSPVLAIREAAVEWLEEIICDAYAVRRFGPAGLSALCGFLSSVNYEHRLSDHPPFWLRCHLMTYWLDGLPAELTPITSPWADVISGAISEAEEEPDLNEPEAGPIDADAEPQEESVTWSSYLCSVFWDARDEIRQLLGEWPAPYDSASRAGIVKWLASEFDTGVAHGEMQGPGAQVSELSEQDVVNAAWLAHSNESRMPVERLAEKSLELVDFLRTWGAADGPVETVSEADLESDVDSSTGILTASNIRGRVALAEGAKRLVVSPALSMPTEGASLDLRLGRYFIQFVRSATTDFSALSHNPRGLQRMVERSWHDVFVLHPGELVLASTLEYIVMPGDLGATVITRSSYGRLGLLTATAIFVHPWFKGCLTLELVNLGEVPLTLQPGERVAQLAFTQADPSAPEPGGEAKYHCHTKPEFSRVREDPEISALRRIRSDS